MRDRAWIISTLVLLPLLLPLFAAATSGGLVDAGDSVAVPPGATFVLQGHVEGFASAPSVAWTAPAGCTVDAPDALATSARCASAGAATFTLTATDGPSSSADDVVVAIGTTVETVLLDRSDTAAGAASAPSKIYNFRVPAGGKRLTATLTPQDTGLPNDVDLQVNPPAPGTPKSSTAQQGPDVVAFDDPEAGPWSAFVEPFAAAPTPFRLVVTLGVPAGPLGVPTLKGRAGPAVLGEDVALGVTVSGAAAPYVVRWESDASSRAFDDGAGGSFTLTYAGPTEVLARVTDALGFETTTAIPVRAREPQPVTIVAVVDSAFSPYHFDFVGLAHPWSADADPSNDLDFTASPTTYIPGHPGANALHLTLPTGASDDVSLRAGGVDADAWAGMADGELYWIPGTKIVGAMHFGGGFVGTNSDHGTRSAASAAGNIHGSCPECLFVLIQDGGRNEGLLWASQQPWIDVITNSYGHSIVGGLVRDNVYLDAPVAATRRASDAGQVIVFSSGNGLVNAFDVPMFTYWSSEKGPDWMITVGATEPNNEQQYSGAGKPVDISSIGGSYPSSGGTTATGTGTHSGTSNAAPVTAGYFAKVLQEAREALGDTTPGHAGGVVASGTPVACGAAVPSCALGDGVLTRAELARIVFDNVLPSGFTPTIGTVWPSTPYNYYYQGHGVLTGRQKGAAEYDAEWTQMVANMVGEAPSLPRPAGETEWFVVDSKCRQRLWGAWAHGDWQGSDPALDAQRDSVALAFDAWCDAAPPTPFAGRDRST